MLSCQIVKLSSSRRKNRNKKDQFLIRKKLNPARKISFQPNCLIPADIFFNSSRKKCQKKLIFGKKTKNEKTSVQWKKINSSPKYLIPAHFFFNSSRKNDKKLLKIKNQKHWFSIKKINSSPKYLIPAHYFFNSSPFFFNSSRNFF